MDLDGDARADVRRILAAGHRLLELVDDVLQISRGQSPGDAPDARPVELRQLVDDAIAPSRTLAGERDVVLEVDPSIATADQVMANQGALTDALAELVSNAVRFSPAGGVVTIAASTTGERVRVRVRDQGPGIDPSDVERAFQPFERLGPVPDGDPGKGLGLTRAKRLVASMGGEVGCESAPGAGATFWIDLRPAVEGARVAPPPPDGPATSSRNGARTLLYIDDSPANLRIVEQTLELRADVSLLTAATGREGLEVATRERPDLVLLDLNLPDMKGEDVLAGLTGAEATGHIPVIMLSADASEATATRLIAAGASDYLTKPFDLAHFLEMVDARLSAGRQA
jgi:CheY-like chemotaxis protein